MRDTAEKRLLAGFTLTLGVAVLLGALSQINVQALLRLVDASRHTRGIILELSRTQAALSEAEAEQRGFLITGDAAYLTRCAQAEAARETDLRALERLSTDDPSARREAALVRAASGARVAELDATVARRRAGGSAGLGRAEMDAAQSAINVALARETGAWDRQQGRRDALIRATQWQVRSLIGAELALLLWAYGLARRDAEGRARAHRAREAQHEELLARQTELVIATRDLAGANARLETASRRFEELYQALPIPCFCFDVAGRIFEWNRAFENCHGLSSAQIFQRHVWEVVAAPQAEGTIRDVNARAFAGEAQDGWELTLSAPQGPPRHLLCSTAPMHGPEGQVTGGISTHLDITDRRRVEEALQVSEARLRAFHDITAAPECDLDGKIESLLRLGCTEFGMTAGLVAQMDTDRFHVRHVVPPDGGLGVDSVCDGEDTLCHEMMRSGEPLAVHDIGDTHRRRHPARAGYGTESYFGVPLRAAGEDWGALCFTGTAPRAAFTQWEVDFLRLIAQWVGGEVEQRRTRQRVLDSEERFRSAILSMQEGFLVQDTTGAVLVCNEAAERILGVPAEALLRRSVVRDEWRAIHPDGADFPREDQPSRRALATGEPQHDVTLGLKYLDGHVVWLSMNSAPLYRAGEDAPHAAVLTFTDITERRCQEGQIAAQLEQIGNYNSLLEFQKRALETQKQAVEEQRQKLEMQKRILERTNLSLEAANSALESLATLDGLTGLKNHRAFQERLETEVSRAQRYGEPLSLILLDVDHFKQYNDTYGHPAGDEVLRTVGRVLEENDRETDFAARYGGEEFVVVLPNTSSEGARVVAERLRRTIAAQDWPARPITASLGAGTLTPAMPDRAALIAATDGALYRAKAAGRDRSVHAADPEDADLEPAPSAPGRGPAAREGRRRAE